MSLSGEAGLRAGGSWVGGLEGSYMLWVQVKPLVAHSAGFSWQQVLLHLLL